MGETPSPLSQGANVPLTGILTCAPRYDLGAQLPPDAGSVAILACRAQGSEAITPRIPVDGSSVCPTATAQK